MDLDLEPLGGVTLFLGIVLVVSIVAGSLSMIVVSALLLAALAGLAYRARVIRRDPERTEDLDRPD
jgi:hypothetical protein